MLIRVIWAMQTGSWPVAEILDHINRDRADNRLSNLRAVDRPANMRNRPYYSKNIGLPKGAFLARQQVSSQRLD